MPKSPQRKRNELLPSTALEKNEKGEDVYICLECKRRGDKIGGKTQWYPEEIPRHLEKAHNIPQEARLLRMRLISKWDERFEKEYLENLYNEIKWEKHDPPDDIEIDNTSRKFKKEGQEQKRREQEARRESD